MRQSICQIAHKFMCGACIAFSDEPANNQFRIGADRRPCPNISETELAPFVSRNVLILGVTERPNFVTLNALAIEVAEGFILVPNARFGYVV
jgi:hypothetical protein